MSLAKILKMRRRLDRLVEWGALSRPTRRERKRIIQISQFIEAFQWRGTLLDFRDSDRWRFRG